MASDGGEPLDPISALVMIIILSVLGYAAYDSIYRFFQGEPAPNLPTTYEEEVVLIPQQ